MNPLKLWLFRLPNKPCASIKKRVTAQEGLRLSSVYVSTHFFQ